MRKILARLGIGAGSPPTAGSSPPYTPYAESSANFMYNLLFCDDFAAFRPAGGELKGPFATLFTEPPAVADLEALAGDPRQEGRIRYLAFSRLRTIGQAVRPKTLLGVITEVPLPQGLDVLAAYSEGGVRYLNQSGKIAVLEGVAAIQPLVQQLFAASAGIVDRIGPWDKSRLPPPAGTGSVRLTFLVSDGLYFGQGAMRTMQDDAAAGPLISCVTALLKAVVQLSIPLSSTLLDEAS
jgi:hypothetical protein